MKTWDQAVSDAILDFVSSSRDLDFRMAEVWDAYGDRIIQATGTNADDPRASFRETIQRLAGMNRASGTDQLLRRIGRGRYRFLGVSDRISLPLISSSAAQE